MNTIVNKKAGFNFTLGEKLEAGVALTGLEVKSIKENRADISNAYVKIMNGEAFLINANMPLQSDDPLRTRKLLLHRKQLISLETKIKQEKLTLIPTKLYTKQRFVKLELALAKSKRSFEKKESIKKKDLEREAQREFKDSQ
jgi:SsrA-binding protein